MVTPFATYLISVADSVKMLFLLVSMAIGVGLFTCFGVMGSQCDTYGGVDYKIKRLCCLLLALLFTTTVINALIPSSETVAAMYGQPGAAK